MGQAFHSLRLHAGAQVIEQLFLDDPSAVVAALDGRAVRSISEDAARGLR